MDRLSDEVRASKVHARVHRYADPAEVAAASAAAVATEIERALAAKGRFRLALAGGNTPRAMYEHLAAPSAKPISTGSASTLFGDERMVPPDDAASNYRMAREALLDRVPIPARNVHRIGGRRARGSTAIRRGPRPRAARSRAPRHGRRRSRGLAVPRVARARESRWTGRPERSARAAALTRHAFLAGDQFGVAGGSPRDGFQQGRAPPRRFRRAPIRSSGPSCRAGRFRNRSNRNGSWTRRPQPCSTRSHDSGRRRRWDEDEHRSFRP